MFVVGHGRDEYARDDEQRLAYVGSDPATLGLSPQYFMLHLPGVEKPGVLLHLLRPELAPEHVGQPGDVDVVLPLMVLYPVNNTQSALSGSCLPASWSPVMHFRTDVNQSPDVSMVGVLRHHEVLLPRVGLGQAQRQVVRLTP